MTLVTELDLEMFNIFDPDEAATLHPRVQAVLADGGWLVQTPLWYSAVDHEAVRDLLTEPRLRTLGATIVEMQGVTAGPLHDFTSRVILSLEGDDHTRQRRLVSRAFTPRAVERLRPMMRDFVVERARAMAAAGGGDLVTDLAEAYPIAVICELVGAPKEDWPRFSGWAEQIFKQFNFDLLNDLPDIERASLEVEAYLQALVEQRRGDLQDDLLSALIAVEEEDGDRLSAQELTDLVGALLLAGTDTTRNQLGLMMMALAALPDQWRALREDPTLVPRAVDESLRFESTVAGAPRVVTETFEYRGVTFPEGTALSLLVMTANRDPKVVRCPMDFDITADRGTWHPMSFGGGAHYCLGANLARAELCEALDVLVHEWESFELGGEPTMKPLLGLYGPKSLPLRVMPATTT
jgi:cytochrome P450